MVDDRCRIGVVEHHPGRCEVERGRLPWRMDGRLVERIQLGNPLADVVAVRVESSALGDRVEDAEVGSGVGARASHPLPVPSVLRWLGVTEQVTEVSFSTPPVDEEILHEK